MKIWFEHCRHYCDIDFDVQVKLGVYWYKHAKPNKRLFKPWRGFTIVFYLIWWQVNINIVDDYEAYKKRINFKYSEYLREKKDAT